MRNLLKKRINTFGIINQNKFLITNSFLIKQELTNALFRKDILVSNIDISQSNNTTALNLEAFTRTSKLLKYRKTLKKKTLNNSRYKNYSKVNSLILNSLKNQFTNSNLLVNYTNINRKIDKKVLTNCFKAFRKFSTVLFSRGFNLFIDFLKIVSLVDQNKINPKMFLLILGQIFRNLTKKKHTKFIFFIKTIFDNLITSENNNVIGIKLVINVKLMGKTRASTVKIERGSLSLNTVNSGCIAEKMHVYTLYGAFGFKIWINYKE
jgi:hypothetical protein